MKSIKDMNVKELGSFICSALKAENIYVVLSGGSCVEIYLMGFRFNNEHLNDELWGMWYNVF